MNIMLDDFAIMPTRAHDTDAGLDLYSPKERVIAPRSYATFDTGVHIELEKGTAGFLKSKSGLNIKHNITSDGVVDVGYTGSIVVKLYNHGDDWYMVNKGDKITQLVIVKIDTPELTVVNEFNKTDRGDSGFGSTGR